MSDENMTWQDVCRELLRLDAEGVEKPWREFEYRLDSILGMHWKPTPNLSVLFSMTEPSGSGSLRLKPRTIRVTTHSGETLELPEPWWDVPDSGRDFWYVDATGAVLMNEICGHLFAANGNAFRSRSDAQAWADAIPKIKGAS